MVTAVVSDSPNPSSLDQYQAMKADMARIDSELHAFSAFYDAVRSYGRPNIAKGRAARKLDHALSALVSLTPEERRGFLIAAQDAVNELEAKRTGDSSLPPQRA